MGAWDVDVSENSAAWMRTLGRFDVETAMQIREGGLVLQLRRISHAVSFQVWDGFLIRAEVGVMRHDIP